MERYHQSMKKIVLIAVLLSTLPALAETFILTTQGDYKAVSTRMGGIEIYSLIHTDSGSVILNFTQTAKYTVYSKDKEQLANKEFTNSKLFVKTKALIRQSKANYPDCPITLTLNQNFEIQNVTSKCNLF